MGNAFRQNCGESGESALVLAESVLERVDSQ